MEMVVPEGYLEGSQEGRVPGGSRGRGQYAPGSQWGIPRDIPSQEPPERARGGLRRSLEFFRVPRRALRIPWRFLEVLDGLPGKPSRIPWETLGRPGGPRKVSRGGP